MPENKNNPKDKLGLAKVPLGYIPPVAKLWCSAAMGNGAKKYGRYNWRDIPVLASVYLDACERHIQAWADGEKLAEDSGVHHLGHAMACLAIIIDAEAAGCLIDDRPDHSGAYVKTLKLLNERMSSTAA